jgi:uncharacterized protein
MSESHVETVRSTYRAFERGDLDAAVAGMAPDADWHQTTPVPDHAVFRGRDEIRDGLFRRFFEDFVDARIENLELIESEGHVAAVGDYHGTGVGSGIDLHFEFAHIWRFEEGRAVWIYDVGATPEADVPRRLRDTVRRGYDAFSRGDVDAAVADVAPHAEWHQTTRLPDRAVYRGRDEIRDSFLRRQFFEQFPGGRLEISRLIESEDHVAVVGDYRARGGTSGLDFHLAFVHIWRFENGQAVWIYDCAGEAVPR